MKKSLRELFSPKTTTVQPVLFREEHDHMSNKLYSFNEANAVSKRVVVQRSAKYADRNVILFNPKSGYLQLTKKVTELLGTPPAVKLYYDNGYLGIAPLRAYTEGQETCYRLTNKRNPKFASSFWYISAGALLKRLFPNAASNNNGKRVVYIYECVFENGMIICNLNMHPCSE